MLYREVVTEERALLKRIVVLAVALALAILAALMWRYSTHFWLADTGAQYDRPIYLGNNTVHYYYFSRTYPSADDIIRMCIEERGGTDYGINYSWKRPASQAVQTYAAYLTAPEFSNKLAADTARILELLRARQEREKERNNAYADGPEKVRGDLLPIAEDLPAALLYRYQYRNDPGCVVALIAEDDTVVPPGLRRLCMDEKGSVVILSDTPAR